MSIESTPNDLSPEVRRAISTPVTSWTDTGEAQVAEPPKLTKDGRPDPRGRHLRGWRKLAPAEVAFDARISAGEVHVVADVRMREGDCHTVCSCGWRVDGDTPEETARSFNEHSRSLRYTASGPVERLLPDDGDGS